MFDARVTGVEFDDDKQLWRVSVPGGNMEFKALIVSWAAQAIRPRVRWLGARLMEKLGAGGRAASPCAGANRDGRNVAGRADRHIAKECKSAFRRGQKPAFSEQGEMLFTHRHKRPAGAVCLVI